MNQSPACWTGKARCGLGYISGNWWVLRANINPRSWETFEIINVEYLSLCRFIFLCGVQDVCLDTIKTDPYHQQHMHMPPTSKTDPQRTCAFIEHIMGEFNSNPRTFITASSAPGPRRAMGGYDGKPSGCGSCSHGASGQMRWYVRALHPLTFPSLSLQLNLSELLQGFPHQLFFWSSEQALSTDCKSSALGTLYNDHLIHSVQQHWEVGAIIIIFENHFILSSINITPFITQTFHQFLHSQPKE